jgi:hypothetical protein
MPAAAVIFVEGEQDLVPPTAPRLRYINKIRMYAARRIAQAEDAPRQGSEQTAVIEVFFAPVEPFSACCRHIGAYS